MEEKPVIESKLLGSLAKVFPDEEPVTEGAPARSALRGEKLAFQAAYRGQGMARPTPVTVRVSAEGLEGLVTVREVGLVPSDLPAFGDSDGHVLRAAPGLYPDPLYELAADMKLRVMPNQWRSLWIEIDVAEKAKPGRYRIEAAWISGEGAVLGEVSHEFEVLSAALPRQDLIHTEWFHADCIASAHGTEMLSERHWELMEAYIETAVRHGVNMILTPLFTPPLDTAVGGERPTMQLVGVEKSGADFAFDFGLLERWIGMCERKGIRYFEFSHLFTQWGARHAPKIVVKERGGDFAMFGWHTDAAGEEYGRFLDLFLPELLEFARRRGIADRCYFHVSDEPNDEHLESYKLASDRLRKHTGELPVIDALSDYAFYEKGLVSHPIPANDHIEPFLEAGVPNLWTYYCSAQYKEVSNRFFDMPSARNRIIGLQLYKFDIEGFLHWGYNFWNSQYSVKAVHPFATTDAGGAFPSGDSFVVYPGEDGPIESLRLKVFYEALQDLRALKLLESLTNKETALRLLEEGLDEPLTFRTYPRSAEWLLAKRERINRAIEAASKPSKG